MVVVVSDPIIRFIQSSVVALCRFYRQILLYHHDHVLTMIFLFHRFLFVTTILQDASNRQLGNAQNGKHGMGDGGAKKTSRAHLARGVVQQPAQPHHQQPVQQMVFEDDRNPAETNGRTRRIVERQVTNDTAAYQFGQPDNIDERDAEDPLCATAYVQDMYDHFRSREAGTSVRPSYMESQPHINDRMRSILVDWLVEVHLKFKLVPETLYLTINLIDRYLAEKEVSRPKLQLVGVTALLIASKYEEIYPPELRDLVYICDRAYSRNEVSILFLCIAVIILQSSSNIPVPFLSFLLQIIDMEETILKTLQYDITIPSAHAFLVRYLKAAHADKKIVQLSCYILDGTLQSYTLLHYLPSQLAAAAVFIARCSVGRNSWSPTLLQYAQYREEDVKPVAQAVLLEKFSSQSKELKAVTKKYTSSRYGGVANIPLDNNF